MAFDLKSAIASIAPTLGTMLLGPLGGTAITALESAFGLSPGAGQDGITQVMQTGAMTPDIIANVRAADQKHQEILAQQNIDLKKMNADYKSYDEIKASVPVSRTILRSWALKGMVDYITLPSGHRRYSMSDINKVLDSIETNKNKRNKKD